MVRGAWAARDIYKNPYKNLLTLQDVFPFWKRGEGIFEFLTGFEFNNTEESAAELNFDYFGNYSGKKIASQLLHDAVDDESGMLDDATTLRLAGIIRRRYTPKWNALWEEYAIQPWFDNISFTNDLTHGKIETEKFNGNIIDRMNGSDSDERTIVGQKHVDEGGSTDDNVSHIGGHSRDITKSGTEEHSKEISGHTDTHTIDDTGDETSVRTGDQTQTTDYTGTVKDTGSSSYVDNTFGFNTTGDTGTSLDKGSGTDGNTRTFEGRKDTAKTAFNSVQDKKSLNTHHTNSINVTGHNETTTISFPTERKDAEDFTYKAGTADNRNITHGKTLTTYYDDGYSDKVTHTHGTSKQREWKEYEHRTSFAGTDGTTVTGRDYRRYSRIQDLIAMYDNRNLFPFFDIIFGDVDKVLCVPIFK